MQKRYYLDTCIWIDYFENRSDRFRPLGEWAFRALAKIIEEEGIILFSNLNEKEFRNYYSKEQMAQMLTLVPLALLKLVKTREKQFEEAKLLAGILRIPTNDAIHAILARDNSAILITRDKHFMLIKGVDIKLPEDLL